MAIPRFAAIRAHIEGQIQQGQLRPGDRVPSENELCQRFAVSRMTARRALQELTEAGLVIRTPGLGSFVAEQRPVAAMMEVRNIADEVASHRARVLSLGQIEADAQQAWLLNMVPGQDLYRSVIVHYDGDTPIQWEDRLVNPAMAPDYLVQDFSEQTPNAYLSRCAPLTEASHKVEATLVDSDIAQALAIAPGAPCLQISRRTWSTQGVVSIATLIHPGDRYCLGGHFHIQAQEPRQ
ncbi:MAG: histidine utilization repressor [Cellvibrionaceae bacterium]|nr:histidine utilization repressor [Cellvibrionaceae bacterium]